MRFDVGHKMSKFFKTLSSLILLVACLGGSQARAQHKIVSAKVTVTPGAMKDGSKTSGSKAPDTSNVAIWLVPLDPAGVTVPVSDRLPKPPQLLQRNKTFEPHVLIVPLGTMVEFPNQDPFFHNIFSLYDGRRFDLGLYESGTKRSVKFDRPGVSFLFCNIHAEMSAVVLSVDTPYFALSDRNGNVTDARVLKPLPMGLDNAALEAVKRWKFTPGTLNGQPVPVIYNLTVNFRLQ